MSDMITRHAIGAIRIAAVRVSSWVMAERRDNYWCRYFWCVLTAWHVMMNCDRSVVTICSMWTAAIRVHTRHTIRMVAHVRVR